MQPDETDQTPPSSTSADCLFQGSTEMHARCSDYDWASTSLGPVAAWPGSLQVAVQLCLDSCTPMGVWAGPDLLVFYNDPYRRILGPRRHPAALGRPAREAWAEHWDWLGPDMERVMVRGESVHREDRRVDIKRRRTGRTEGSYFTYSFTPIHDAGGGIVGVFKAIQETTADVREMNELRGIFELSHDLLTVADTDGWFRRVNLAFTRILGWSEEQMLTHPISFFVHPDDLASTYDELRRLANREDSTAFENRYRHVDGSYRWLSWTGVKDPVEDRIYAAARDITEAKQATEALATAHALLEGITEGTEDMIATVDSDLRFTYFNDSLAREFERIWGVTLAVGDDVVGVLAPWPEQRKQAVAVWGRALDGESFRLESTFAPTQEATQIYDFRFSPVRDARGRVAGAAQIIRDVSDRVRVQQELEARQRELREADRRKDEFLAMLGHELRNPLSAISSATQLLEVARHDPESLTHATETLTRQTSRMVRLVDGLLEVSRLAQGKISLECETIDLRQVLDELITDWRRQLDTGGLDLRVNLPTQPVWVSGDAVRLSQIVDNLIGNAAKFTDAPGTITLALCREGDEAVVVVRDTGVGIRQDLLDQIFEPFQQDAQAVDRSQGGLGLGLALSKGLTEMHDGTLEVKSEGKGRGAEFRVRIPLTHADVEAREDVEKTPHRPIGARRLLLVEDDPDASKMMAMLLRKQGHEVTAVRDGSAALGELTKGDVDLVLCDIGLPGMSGYDFARAARADESLRDLPLVAITGYGQPADKRRTAEAGFDAHLTKPVEPDLLEDVLRRFS